MQYADALQAINWLAVIVGTLLSFAVGGLWYSKKAFGEQWQKLVKLRTSDITNANMAQVMGGTFALSLVANAFLAVIMQIIGSPVLNAVDGSVLGALVGTFFVSASIGINYLYEQKSIELWAINNGYLILNFIVAGFVIGGWA